MANVKQDPSSPGFSNGRVDLAVGHDVVRLAAETIGHNVSRSQQGHLFLERPLFRWPHSVEQWEPGFLGDLQTTP